MKILYAASTWQHLLHFHIPYIQELRRRGHVVHAAAGGKPLAFPYADQAVSLPLKKKMTAPGNFRAARRLSKRIWVEGYDLVAVHTSLAAFFVRLAVRMAGTGCPVCNTVHGYLFDAQTPFLKRKVLLEAEKYMASVTDTVVVMTREDYGIARENRLFQRQLFYLPGMGVDFSRFPQITPLLRREARERLGYGDEDFVLVFAAEFSTRKNQAMLIRAMAQLPPRVKLLLLGDGALLEECRQLALQQKTADRIRFEGYQRDTAAYYAGADICVSSSRSEGLPFNVMEAMGRGLPVAASDVKGNQDLIRHGENGLLYPYGDVEGCAAQMKRLLNAPEEARRMGERSRADSLAYGLEAVLPQVMEVYQQSFPALFPVPAAGLPK